MNLSYVINFITAVCLLYIQIYFIQCQTTLYPNLLLIIASFVLLQSNDMYIKAIYLFFLELFFFIQSGISGLTTLIILFAYLLSNIQEKLYVKVIASCILLTNFQVTYALIQWIKVSYPINPYQLLGQLIISNSILIIGYHLYQQLMFIKK